MVKPRLRKGGTPWTGNSERVALTTFEPVELLEPPDPLETVGPPKLPEPLELLEPFDPVGAPPFPVAGGGLVVVEPLPERLLSPSGVGGALVAGTGFVKMISSENGLSVPSEAVASTVK